MLGKKGDTAKQIAFLAERKAALNLKRDRAYEEMTALEQQEADLKTQFKEAAGAITKRRITGQMLQLRKDLERRQQTLSMLDKQITVVATDLHHLELVQHGKSAKLPDSDKLTEHAVEAEEMLADLDVSAELAGSVGPASTSGMSDEEKALYEELEREAASDVVIEEEEPETEPEPVAKKESAAKKSEPRTPEKKNRPANLRRVHPCRGSRSRTDGRRTDTRRAEPEAG